MYRGRYTSVGFLGWVDDRYILFATEQEYIDYINER